MSDLQLSLLAASGVVIIGVFTYNKWQEWRHRKVAEAVFQDEQPDVLMGEEERTCDDDSVQLEPESAYASSADSHGAPVSEERREPSFLPPSESASVERIEPSISFEAAVEPYVEFVEAPATDINVEPVVERVVSQNSPPAQVETASPVASIPALPADVVHRDCDAVVVVELIAPLKSADILLAQRSALSKISKPLFWLGLNADHQWQILTAETAGVFQHLRLVLQLADRQGPITEQDIYLLQNAAQEIALQWNAVIDVSDIESALIRGRQLDQFCVEVDLQIGINLVGPVPFPGTKIRALAEAAGMSLNTLGLFEKQDDNGRVLFTLSNQEANPFAAETLRTMKTHGLTFLLDVPRVAETGFVFDHMLRLAKQFSEALQARIVDDNRRPLTEAQLSSIREQFVQKPQADMAAKRIPTGSTVALRLFS